MISRHSTEKTEKTETTPRRTSNRRGLKKRSILPSFGDIVLPVVSIAAVGLLILAGSQFFVNGIGSSPSITTTRAYTDSPAIMAERQKDEEPVTTTTVADVKNESNKSSDVASSSGLSSVSEPETAENTILALSRNKATPKTQARTQAVTQTQTQTRTRTQAQTPAVQAPKKAPAPELPPNKQWRVQTGAYTSRAGAQEAVNKIKKAGYKARVYQNPASRHFKVWVQGGATKSQAERVVAAMKKLGYKSSFSFPPAK